MAVALLETKPLTYEEYLAEGEVEGQYDIVDGVRVFMTSPSRRHNRIADRICRRAAEMLEAAGVGTAISAPSDVLISQSPRVQVRQPDVYMISFERLNLAGDDDSYALLTVAPEIVVEVLSPSDHRLALQSKLDDYAAIRVSECWLVSPEAADIQVLRLRDGSYETVDIFGVGETAKSEVFPGLSISVDDIFDLPSKKN